MKQGVLFCLACWDFQTMALNAGISISLESYGWIKVHWLGLFGATVWKLFIIESFSQWKLNKVGNENCIGIWRCSWPCWKALDKSDLTNLFHNCLSKGVKDIDFWVDLVVVNSNKLQKLSFKGKISWALSVLTLSNLETLKFKNVKNKECVHTWANNTCHISMID
jgi:hypothetical protein